MVAAGGVLMASSRAGAQYGPVRADVPAKEKPYLIHEHETVGCPPGYHPETRPRYGPLVGGAITAGLGGLYVVGALSATGQEGAGTMRAYFGIIGGAHLAVGLPLILYSLLSPQEVYVSNPAPAFSASIVPDPAHPRFSVEATF